MLKHLSILFIAGAAVWSVRGDFAFTQMDESRVLLMNNDTNATFSVGRWYDFHDTAVATTIFHPKNSAIPAGVKLHGQDCYDTNIVDTVRADPGNPGKDIGSGHSLVETYWEHSDEKAPTSPSALKSLGILSGTTHVFYRNRDVTTNEDGVATYSEPEKLWQLNKCRVGSFASRATGSQQPTPSNRNFIPSYFSHAVAYDGQPLTSTSTANDYYPYDFSAGLMNNTNAWVMSPYYAAGVGTIYFDAVNGWTAMAATGAICLEVATATNGCGSAAFEDEENATNLVWRKVGFDVFCCTNTSTATGTTAALNPVRKVVHVRKVTGTSGDDAFTLAQCKNGNTTKPVLYVGNCFYRIRATLDFRQPMRFRIRRASLATSTTSEDQLVYLLIDNIVASYPPIEYAFEPLGKSWDPNRAGERVLGWEGAFTEPFLYAGVEKEIFPRVKIRAVENPYAMPDASLFDAFDMKVAWRWRYLEHLPTEAWTTNDLIASGGIYRGQGSVDLSRGPGDVEFRFSGKIRNAPHFTPTDFAVYLSTPDPYGDGWVEGRSEWTIEGRWTGSGTLPSGGTDYFARVREGASPCEDVVVVVTLDAGADKASSSTNYMTLVAANAWRFAYEVPTNYLGKAVSYHFETINRQESGAVAFAENRACVYPQAERINFPDQDLNRKLPYSGGTASAGLDGEVYYDGTSSHIVFEFNDSVGSLTLSHGTVQDFKSWTDATQGFVGNFVNTSGVSSVKAEWAATNDFERWHVSSSSNTAWQEDFKFQEGQFGTDCIFDVQGDWTTPRNWKGRNSLWVSGNFTNVNSVTLQLAGQGKGTLTTDTLFTNDMLPEGVGTFEVMARAAQTQEFHDFAYYKGGTECTNYAFSAQITMSPTTAGSDYRTSDMSPASPTISLVAYYQPGQGCYEWRIRRVEQDKLEHSLIKWYSSGNGYANRCLKRAYTSASGVGDGVKVNPNLLTSRAANARKAWTYAYIAAYSQGTANTHLICKLSNAQTESGSISASAAGLGDPVLEFDDNEQPISSGSYGIGSTDCPAVFGQLRIHPLSPATFDISDWNGTLESTAGHLNLVSSAGNVETYNDKWAYAPGRMRQMLATETYVGSYAKDCGIVALVPTNTLELKIADVDAGTDYQSCGCTCVITSFGFTRYSFAPHTTARSRVQLVAGGTDRDSRVDVAVRSVQMTSWRAEDDPQMTLTAGRREWIYTDGWITNATKNSLQVLLQPMRGVSTYPMSLRSPYMAEGFSRFAVTYTNAHKGARLLLQVATNDVTESGVNSLTTKLEDWTTIADIAFTADQKGGTWSPFVSFRAPVSGVIRVIMDPQVIAEAAAHRRDYDPMWASVGLTAITCWNEPALDVRSWWGWNVKTMGWNADGTPGLRGYLNDWTAGLSLALNFSGVPGTGVNDPEFAEPENASEYGGNDPFVQGPEMAGGVSRVEFKARPYDLNQTTPSVVTVLGADSRDAQTWTELGDIYVTNGLPYVYSTYAWQDAATGGKYKAVRLAVRGAKEGRNSSDAATNPVQRVLLENVVFAEAIEPKVGFVYATPFRSQLKDDVVVSNATDASEQPLTGESWGIQAQVAAQQMSDELDMSSVRVFVAFKRGEMPWGYANWKDSPDQSSELLRVDDSNLVFRSSYQFPASVMTPTDESGSVVQFCAWTVYADKSGVIMTNVIDTWETPSWYWPLDKNETLKAQGYSPYVILEPISPYRAWINEINYHEDEQGTNQYLEIAVPEAANLSDWYVAVRSTTLGEAKLFTFGYNNAKTVMKVGSRPGVDSTNSYSLLSLCSPLTTAPNVVSAADGVWDRLTDSRAHLDEGGLREYEAYGISLVRKSGVVEHQVVVQGTNIFENTGYAYIGSGTNLLNDVRAADGPRSRWFFAGEDKQGSSIGVWKSHGESEECWTNWMFETVSEINRLKDGTLQFFDPDWYLRPNGTNVWIYAKTLGANIYQEIAGVTNQNDVILLAQGQSTSILYHVSQWHQIAAVMTNALGAAAAPVPESVRQPGVRAGDERTWTLELNDVQSSMSVEASVEGVDRLTNAVWGIARDNRYYNAVLDWLQNFDDESEIKSAEYWNMAGQKAADLGLLDMYWLNINPVEGNWIFQAGMSTWGQGAVDGTGRRAPTVDYVLATQYVGGVETVVSNARIAVFMMISNTASAVAYAPGMLRGVESGSDSSGYNTWTSPNWTSVNFKVTGALNTNGVENVFRPLRWFVFGPDSFGPDFKATIEIVDPFSPSSPGWHYGWGDFRHLGPNAIFYKWSLDDRQPQYDSVEMLKTDSTY